LQAFAGRAARRTTISLVGHPDVAMPRRPRRAAVMTLASSLALAGLMTVLALPSTANAASPTPAGQPTKIAVSTAARSAGAKMTATPATGFTIYGVYIEYRGLPNGNAVCLGMSYLTAYTTNCNTAGGTFDIISPDGVKFQLRADNTGLCLSNFNYSTVYPAQCNKDSTGQSWAFTADGGLYNLGTQNYLATDFSRNVYLNATSVGPWDWY
jgi:hypothetical protein